MSKLDVRAAWAWKATDLAAKSGKSRARYGTLARKLPGYLQTNGLGQTLAFLYSKAEAGDPKASGSRGSDNGDRLMLELLGGWLLSDRGAGVDVDNATSVPRTHAGAALDWVTGLDAAGYRAAAHEARECALWLRRFAEGRIEGEEA